jgi:hypothetical protein
MGPLKQLSGGGGGAALGAIQTTTVVFSAAQFALKQAVPVLAVAAPGVGLVIQPVSIEWEMNVTVALGFAPTLRCQFIGAPFNAFNIFTDFTFQPGVVQRSRTGGQQLGAVFMGGANHPANIGLELTLTQPGAPGTANGQATISFVVNPQAA